MKLIDGSTSPKMDQIYKITYSETKAPEKNLGKLRARKLEVIFFTF